MLLVVELVRGSPQRPVVLLTALLCAYISLANAMAFSPTGAMPLETPNWHERDHKTLTHGQRAADVLRNGMGSWPFVGLSALHDYGAALNARGGTWDPHPYDLLNLLLSTLAGLQGTALLTAAKRQESIAAALAQQDFETNTTPKTDIERVLKLNTEHTLTIQELQEISRRLDGQQPRN